MSVRMQARTLQRLRSALADMEGVSLVCARHGCVLSVLPPGPCLSRAYGVEPYTQYADVLAWHERRQNARPKQITPGVVNPYSKYEEPKPWAAIHARFIEQAVRNRPANKNRMRWDRMVQRQLQMMVRSRPSLACPLCRGATRRTWSSQVDPLFRNCLAPT